MNLQNTFLPHFLGLLGLSIIVVTIAFPVTIHAVATQNYLLFDGNDDFVEIPSSAAFDLNAGEFTLSAWILPTSWGENEQGRIIDHGGGSGGENGWSLHLENKASLGSQQALRVQINNSSSFNGTSDSGAIVVNAWQHVAVTFAGGIVTFYVNGVESGIRTGVPTPIASGDDMRIGQRTADTNRNFDGNIDEVRIWVRALNAAEIQANMNADLSGSEPGLVAYYKFNEGAGQVATDVTGNGHDGTLGSSTAVDASDPTWVFTGPPVNTAPFVSAGTDRVIILPTDTVNLDGTVTDDGLPEATLLTSWSVFSGPDVVNFGDPTSADTTATFFTEGTYILRLTADDTEFVSAADVTVSVDPFPVLTTIVVTPNFPTVLIDDSLQFIAQGFDQIGDSYTVNPIWSATGGTINSTGLFTAGLTPGQFTVTAMNGSINTSVSVSVLDPGQIWPTQSWSTATPLEMGMDQTKLEQARDYAQTGGGAGFIIRGGKLVMSWGNVNEGFDLKSTTKSIGVTALGLALIDGLVSLDDLAQQHLPEIGIPPSSNVSTGWLDEITILQLATATAGFDKSGGFIDLLFEPGTVWAYTDGGANWLADLLTVVYGEDLNDVMLNRVFSVLGISSYLWRENQYRDDTINGIKRREIGSGITMNVSDMARIGYLYLRRGFWDGNQIIPGSFVEGARTIVPGITGLPVMNDLQSRFAGASDHYGMLWWNNADGSMPNVPTDAYWAWGLGDSLIAVIPSLDIVVTRAGQEWSGSRIPSYYIVLEPFLEPIAQSVFLDFCAGDFAPADGDVDGSDLAIFAADFGRTNCASGPPCEGDFDNDNDVDGSDPTVFAADFGRTDCP